MSEQNSSNHIETLQADPSLSESSQNITPLSKKKVEYLNFLRSQKRELLLQEKRINNQEDAYGQGIPIMEYRNACFEKDYALEQLPDLVSSLYSPNGHRIVYGMIGIFKLLDEVNPRPIQLIIETGILPQVIGFLRTKEKIQLQLEAAAILTNLTSGTTEQKKEIISNGAIPGLIKLLESQILGTGAQAASALGNIAAAEGVDLRDMVLQGGAVGPLIKMMEKGFEERNFEAIKQGNRTLSYLCMEIPFPPYGEVKDSVPIFAKVIMSQGQEDVDVLEDALCALVYLSGVDEEKVQERAQEKVQRVLNTGVVPFVVKLLEHSEARIVSPCIKIIGLLFRGGCLEQADYLLAIPGILDKIFLVLKHQQISIRRDAAATLVNIAGRHPERKDHIIKNADYLDQILFVGMNDMLKVREEMTWVMNYLLDEPTPEQWKILLEKKVFEYFEKLLEDDENDFIQEVGIRGIKVILDLKGMSGDLSHEKLKKNEEALLIIRKFKSHKNSEVAEIARQILQAVEQ